MQLTSVANQMQHSLVHFSVVWHLPSIHGPSPVDFSWTIQYPYYVNISLGEHWCGDATELEGKGLISNTLPDLLTHPRGLCEKDWFWQGEIEMRVRGCRTTWSCVTTQLCGSMKFQTLHVIPQAGTNRVCISMVWWYDKMMSIYSRVSRIYPFH